MKLRLAANSKKSNRIIGISIPDQKGNLEKNHAGIPNCGSAAKTRQEHASHHRLDLEKQECIQEDCKAKNGYHMSVSASNPFPNLPGLPDDDRNSLLGL